jgi:hypothetical protein
MSHSRSPQNNSEVGAVDVGDSVAVSRQEAPTPKPWRRFVLLVLLVQSTLFWQGCEQKHALFSLGLAGPAVTVGIGDSLVATKVFDVSLLFAIANLVAIAAAAVVFAYAAPRWANRITSTRWLVAVALATAIFNSCLYFPLLWFYVVSLPVVWLATLLFERPGDEGHAILGTLSRVYYLVGIAAIWGALSLVRLLSRRYLFVDPDRWQFSLAGLLALMVLLGTGIGMLLRVLFS